VFRLRAGGGHGAVEEEGARLERGRVRVRVRVRVGVRVRRRVRALSEVG